MSKKEFKKSVVHNKVVAIPTRSEKNAKGEIVKQFYDIYMAR